MDSRLNKADTGELARKAALNSSEIKNLTRVLVKPLLHFIGYFLVIPLSYVIPKTNYVVLISRFGDFDGNLKYLYLYLTRLEDERAEFVFLTDKKGVYENLKVKGIRVWYYPSLVTMFRLLRTRLIIVDGNEWTKQLKYFFLFNSKKVQVWHGTGLKTIGLLKPAVKALSGFRKKFKKENTYYDLVVLSSDYQVSMRGGAFRYGHLLVNGLPRNDIFFDQDLIKDNNLGCDNEMIEQAVQFKKNGLNLITYAPTWRKYDYSFDHLSFKDLEAFAKHNRLIYILKLHPKHRCMLDLKAYQHIVEYDQYSDIYPLLTLTDLLITDYSSIYLDYLLTDRPIVFYPYDGDEYIGAERELLLDYEQMTPGPMCYSQREMEHQIQRILVEGKDDYSAERKSLRKKFFKYKDGRSAERLWQAVKNNLLTSDS